MGLFAPFPEDATVYVAPLIFSQNKRRIMHATFVDYY